MYVIRTANAPLPVGHYSQGTSAARYVYVSAQLPQDPRTGKLVEASVGAMVAQCVKNASAVLADAELGLEDVCSVEVWLTNLDDLTIVDEVLAERFSKPYPARTVVGVSALPLGSPVQIACIACR